MRLAAAAVALTVAACPLAGCAPDPFEIQVQLLVDEVQDPLATADSIVVDVLYPEGDPVTGAVDAVTGEQRLEGLRQGVGVIVEITVTDAAATVIARGRSQPFDIGLEGGEAAVFVGATDSLARIPEGLSVARTFAQAVAAPGGRVVVVGGGNNQEGSDGDSVPEVEFVGWSATEPFSGLAGADLDRIGHDLVYVPADAGGPWAGQALAFGGTLGAGRDTLDPAWADAVGTVSAVDPVTGVVSEDVAELGDGYMDLRAVWTPEARIALIGGYNQGGSYTQDIRVFDPDDGSIADGPDLAPREQHAVTQLPIQGEPWFLISGGIDATGAGIRDDLALWDGYTNSLLDELEGVTLTEPRFRHQATALGTSHVLITGGSFNDAGDELVQGTSLRTAEVFDPVFRSVTPTNGDMLVGRQRHVAVPIPGDRALICGGEDSCGNDPGSSELYTAQTGLFEAFTRGSMSPGGPGIEAVPLGDGRVLFVGGGSQGGPDDSLYLYTPTVFGAP